MKSIFVSSILIMAILLVGMLAYKCSTEGISSLVERKDITYQSTEVVITKMNEVQKIIFAEGEYVETFNHVNYDTWKFDFLKKEMIIKATAKVGLGIDKDSIEYRFTPTEMIISKLPTFEFIFVSIDYEYLLYEDSHMNRFTKDQINLLNATAKEKLMQVILDSSIQKRALSGQVIWLNQVEELLKPGRTLKLDII